MTLGIGIGVGLNQNVAEDVIAGGPDDMSSVYSWYDASDTSTITHLLNAVSQWDDKGPNGKTIAQAGGSSQPTTGSNMNGRNSIYFDGGDSLRSVAYALTLLGSDVLITAAFEGDSAAVKRLCGWPAAPTPQWMDTQGYGNFTGNPYVLTAATAATAAPHTQTVRLEDTSSEMWLDGVSKDTASYVSQADVLSATFDVGQTGAAAAAFVGKISELVIYTDASERTALETYMSTKWGTP